MANKKRRSRPQSLQKPQTQDIAGQRGQIIKQEYSGPLPPPHALEQYNNIIPDGAERIMAMAEKQGKHRRELEKKALNTDSRNSLLGIISALIIGLAAIIASVIVVLKNHVWPGTILGSAGLVGLVTVFIYGTNQRRSEREAKAKLMRS